MGFEFQFNLNIVNILIMFAIYHLGKHVQYNVDQRKILKLKRRLREKDADHSINPDTN